MKTNLKPTSTSPPPENSQVAASPASASGSAPGTLSESLSEEAAITPLPPGTINSSESSPPAQRFIGLVEMGLSAWIKAGELLVEMAKEEGKQAFETILRECPWMNEPMLWNFYRIGEHKLYPKTLIFCTNQTVARELASLPWDDQAKVCEQGLPLLVGDRLVPKAITEVDRQDIALGICDGRLCGIDEQRRLLAEREPPSRSTNLNRPSHVAADAHPGPAPSMAISTGFYRVTLSFGSIAFTKIPAPKVASQPLTMSRAMSGELHAFIEVLRLPE